MTEIPAWVRMVFLATALAILGMQLVGANAQEAETELQPPSEVCAVYATPDDLQNCYLLYLSEREYHRVTDPAQAALTAAFPVLAVVFMAFLAWKFGGN